MDTVTCADCGEPILEPVGTPPERRARCPKCGSTARSVTLFPGAGSAVASGHAPVIQASSIASLPALLAKAIVVPGAGVPDGRLIEAVALPWLDIVEILRRNPAAAYEIPAGKWEEIVAGSYERAGFDEVILTPRSGDYGRDVIATLKGIGTIRVIDQVKAYKPGHLVTADDVRALYGVVVADNASKGFLTTTSDFAPRLKDDKLLAPLIPSRLGLTNGVELLRRLSELAAKGRDG